jgi:lactate racemase
MKIELKYGKGEVAFDVPSSWATTILEPRHPSPLSFRETLLASLSEPHGSLPLDQWLQGKKNVLVIVSDVTRYTGTEQVLPVLREEFLNRTERVRVVFALGNHRKQTEAERRALVSDSVFEAWPCQDHDCFDDTRLSDVGTTTSGMRVKVNSLLMEADGIIVTGAISFHYLAGFGGGRKCIIPGVAGYETILDVHRRVFRKDGPGKHERAQTGVLEGNPMHEAIMEGIRLIKKPLFLINTVLDDKKNALAMFSGDIEQSHSVGCAWYNEHFSATVARKADVVVVSVGGYPKDIDFIQTHKALEHAKLATKPGGTIILLGKCEDGIGNPFFMPWFEHPSAEVMEPHVRQSDKIYSQTAYSTRIKAEKYKIMVVSGLDEDQVRKMGMTPKDSPEEALTSLDTGKRLVCHVIPEGSKTLVRE